MNEFVLDENLMVYLGKLGVGKVYSEDGKTVTTYDKLNDNCTLTNREVRLIIGTWNCSKAVG